MLGSNVTSSLRIVQPTPPGGSSSDDKDCISVEDHKPLIPPGKYSARYTGHRTHIMFARAHKVILEFEVCEGPYARNRIPHYGRAKRVAQPTGSGGKFTLSAGGDLYRRVLRVLDRNKVRADRISLAAFRSMLFTIHVRTVDKDSRGAPLPEAARYSVVDTFEDGR